MMKKLKAHVLLYANSRDNGNIQCYDEEERKLKQYHYDEQWHTHTLTDQKIIKGPFDKNNVATIKNK